jgi:hypothetical protein
MATQLAKSPARITESSKNTGKSGLTPVNTFTSPSKADDFDYKVHYYQQHRFRGFTTISLQDFEAMATLDKTNMKMGLTNPIHPLLEKSQWIKEEDMPSHLGSIPLRGGYDGYWLVGFYSLIRRIFADTVLQAENPVVWEILEPALKLASLVLTSAHHYPWYVSLMYVSKHQLTISGGMLYSLMTISTIFQIRVKTQRMFLSIFSDSEHALRTSESPMKPRNSCKMNLRSWPGAFEWRYIAATLMLSQDPLHRTLMDMARRFNAG